MLFPRVGGWLDLSPGVTVTKQVDGLPWKCAGNGVSGYVVEAFSLLAAVVGWHCMFNPLDTQLLCFCDKAHDLHVRSSKRNGADQLRAKLDRDILHTHSPERLCRDEHGYVHMWAVGLQNSCIGFQGE